MSQSAYMFKSPTHPGLERPTFEPQLRRFQKNGHRCNGIKANRCVTEADEIWRENQTRKKGSGWIKLVRNVEVG
jgi:hypothetical protein